MITSASDAMLNLGLASNMSRNTKSSSIHVTEKEGLDKEKWDTVLSEKASVGNTSSDIPKSHHANEAFDNPTLAEMTRELKGCGYNSEEAEECLNRKSWITPEEFEWVMNSGLAADHEEEVVHPSSSKKNEKPKKKSVKQVINSEKRKAVQEARAPKKKKYVKKNQDSVPEEEDAPEDVADHVTYIVEEEEVEEKRVPEKKKKSSRQDVHDVPIIGISFHTIQSASRWKFVILQSIAPEHMLSDEALAWTDVVDLLKYSGLFASVTSVWSYHAQLVREFIVNLPDHIDDATSPNFQKVYVRNKCIEFSPNHSWVLGIWSSLLWTSDAFSDQVDQGTVWWQKGWPQSGLYCASLLNSKYVGLHKIGVKNWLPTAYSTSISLLSFYICLELVES